MGSSEEDRLYASSTRLGEEKVYIKLRMMFGFELIALHQIGFHLENSRYYCRQKRIGSVLLASFRIFFSCHWLELQ